MGGKRETFVGEASKTVETPKSITIQRIRIHEGSDGEVHFHDDKSGLKATCPVAIWFKAWQEITRASLMWKRVDLKNKTVLKVETTIRDDSVGVNVSISPCEVSDDFIRLKKFTEG